MFNELVRFSVEMGEVPCLQFTCIPLLEKEQAGGVPKLPLICSLIWAATFLCRYTWSMLKYCSSVCVCI